MTPKITLQQVNRLSPTVDLQADLRIEAEIFMRELGDIAREDIGNTGLLVRKVMESYLDINPELSEHEEILEKSLYFASEHHQGQYRANGDPFLVHALHAGGLLTFIRRYARTISAGVVAVSGGILHDSVEGKYDFENLSPKENAEIRRDMLDAMYSYLGRGSLANEITTKVHYLTPPPIQDTALKKRYIMNQILRVRDHDVDAIRVCERAPNLMTLAYLGGRKNGNGSVSGSDRRQRIVDDTEKYILGLAKNVDNQYAGDEIVLKMHPYLRDIIDNKRFDVL